MRPGREESLNGPTLPLLKNKAPPQKEKYNIIHTHMLLLLIFEKFHQESYPKSYAM